MKFEEWEPHYRELLGYFTFDRAADEEAARVLATLLPYDDLPLLEAACRDRQVTVCGNAPRLQDEIGTMRGTVFAADAAALVLHAHGIRPHAIFTDLDGAEDEFLTMNAEGTIVVVHAHGDNIPLLRQWVPRFTGPLVGTTQAAPLRRVHNFGGFTDGDRAVFAAHELGASQVTLAGFNFDDPTVDPLKRSKLHWARYLLRLIGHAC